MSTGSLEASDAAAAAVQKTEHRVTLDSMRAKVVGTEFVYPSAMPSMTVCFMSLENGFVLVGKSAPADPANFDAELGRKFAMQDCINQMWPLESYLLRQMLAQRVDVGV